MKGDQSFSERVRQRLESWKTELDELQVQLNLGRKEAADKFEEQKRQLREWIDRQVARIDEAEGETGAELRKLRDRLRDLYAYVSRGRAENREDFEAQHEDLGRRMDDVHDQADQTRTSDQEQTRRMADDIDDEMDKFRARLDMLALQFHLGRKEAEEELRELREEAREKLRELREKAAGFSGDAGEGWTWFRGEVRETMDRLARSFRGKRDDEGMA
jgi:hypothetical protein